MTEYFINPWNLFYMGGDWTNVVAVIVKMGKYDFFTTSEASLEQLNTPH